MITTHVRAIVFSSLVVGCPRGAMREQSMGAILKFLSPKIERGDYTLTVTVLGEHFFWQAKQTTFGSTSDHVSVRKISWSIKPHRRKRIEKRPSRPVLDALRRARRPPGVLLYDFTLTLRSDAILSP